MEEYIGPDGRRKVRMTQSEFNAANGIKPALVANAPLRSNAPPDPYSDFYPGRISRDGGKTWALPGEPVGFSENFAAGVNAQPNAKGAAGTLGNAARSLAVMAPFGLATGGLGAVGYGLGMVGGGAADRVITKNLEAGYTSTPRTARDQVRSAVEGGAMGLGSALLGGAAGTVAGKFLPAAAGEAPRLGTQAAMAVGEAVGWEGVSAPIEGRPFSTANAAQDVAFFTGLKGVEAIPGLGARLTSAINPDPIVSNIEATSQLPVLDLPPAPAQAQPSAQLVPMGDVPLTDVPMGRAQTEAFIDEINATLMRRRNLPELDSTEALRAALSKPAPYDYNPDAAPNFVPFSNPQPQRPVEAIPSQPAEMPLLPERSAPSSTASLDPLASQPLSDPNAPMTKGDMAEFLDSLNKQIEARNKSQALEPMGEPLPAPAPRPKPTPEEPVLPGAPLEDYQRRSMLGRVARQEGNPGIAPTPEVFEPMGGGGGYVGPPQPARPEPREFEQPFIPGDRNEPDFRSLVPAGAKIQADPNTNSPEISMKLVDEQPAPKPEYKAVSDFMNRYEGSEQYTASIYKDGKLVGDASYSVSPDGTAKIGKVNSFAGPNSIGPAGVMAMRRDIMAGNKNIKTFVGDRVTGATAKNPNPQQAPQNAPESIISPKPPSDTAVLENSAPKPVESVISEREPTLKAPIPPELEKARLDFQNQDTLINGRLTRNQTVAPYLEKRRDALLDTLDKKLEEVYPGIGPDERAAFIDSGKVPSRTKVLTSAEPDVTISTTETKAETAGGSAMESGEAPAWGMTQKDYVKFYMDSAAAKAKADGTFTSTDWMAVRIKGENAHKASVDEAVKNGNFVPDDVLADYPDSAPAVEYNDPYTLAENKRQADLADTANGFLEGKPQVRRAAIQKALSKKFAFSTGPTDIRNYIENRNKKGELAVNSYESGGKTVYTVNDLKLGKTAYDYAKHLLDNPPAPAQTPTPQRSLIKEERGAAFNPLSAGAEWAIDKIKSMGSNRTTSIKDGILERYLAASGGEVEKPVRLSDIRKGMPGSSREEIDAVLLQMQKEKELVLYPNEDPQSVTPRDNDAALWLGGDRRDFVYLRQSALDAAEKRSLLSEERGAAIRPGEVLKRIKERISEAAANTPAARDKAFVAKQKELHKKYREAPHEEKVKIREEMVASIEAHRKDFGLDPEAIKAEMEVRAKKGLVPAFTPDTTPYEGKKRPELAKIAEEMGVPNRGTNEALIQQIANKAELRRINKTVGTTPEQLQSDILDVTRAYKEATRKKGIRGSVKNFVRGVDAALIDSRNPMKKENRERFGEAGEAANRLAEKAVTSPVHVQIEVNETIDSIFGDLDSKTPVKRADYYQNPAFLDEDLVTERDLLNELIVTKSSYELAKKQPDFLFTNGNTEAKFKATLDAIEASPSGEKLLAKAEEYFAKMQEMVEDLYDAGVITEKYRDELLENQHYMPRKVFKEDVSAGIDAYLYKINMNDTLHEPLSGGSLEAIENDSSLLMAHVIQRTRQRIANNDTAVELIRLFDEGNLDGSKDGFAVRKPKGKDAEQDRAIREEMRSDPVPTGHSIIKGFIEGREYQLVAPDWYVDSYRGHDKHRANETAVKLAKFSGAGLLRESATGALAPYFFTRNFAKDVVHLWQTQDAYSTALPKAAYDIVKDVWAVKGDAWQGLNGRKARGLLRDYLANGGGGATMSEYTNSARNPQGRFKGFLHAMGSMNQWSEQAVRLAHYKHLIDKGVDPRAAAAAARDRINFSQGGWLTKNLNLVAPYTNARVQGTRSLVAAMKRDPKRFAKVQAQSLGLSVAKAAAIYAAGEWADDQLGNPLGRIYDMVSDEEKVHNHIIPTPFGRYEKGVFKPFYFRIAKDESEKIPTYIGEQIGRILNGRAPNWQPLEEVLSGSAVATDIGSFIPPVWQAYLAYAGNYDLFRREYVYKGGDVTDPNFGIDDRSLERKNANDFFQDAGALTGLSPDGTQAALGKLLNGGNPMWGPFSEAYSVMKAMSGGDVEREKEISQHYADMLFSLSGGLGRFVRSDSAAVGVQIAENRRTNRESVLQNEEIEKLTKGISKASDVAPAMRKGFEWVNTLPVEQRGAVARRLVNAAEMKTYPEEVQGLARELFWMKEPKLQALNYLNSQLSADAERRKAASIAFGASGAASDGQTQLHYSRLEGKFREKIKAAKGGAKSSIDLKSEAAWLDMP